MLCPKWTNDCLYRCDEFDCILQRSFSLQQILLAMLKDANECTILRFKAVSSSRQLKEEHQHQGSRAFSTISPLSEIDVFGPATNESGALQHNIRQLESSLLPISRPIRAQKCLVEKHLLSAVRLSTSASKSPPQVPLWCPAVTFFLHPWWSGNNGQFNFLSTCRKQSARLCVEWSARCLDEINKGYSRLWGNLRQRESLAGVIMNPAGCEIWRGGGRGINDIPLQLPLSSLQQGSFCFLPHLPGTSLLLPAGCLLSLQHPHVGLCLRQAKCQNAKFRDMLEVQGQNGDSAFN